MPGPTPTERLLRLKNAGVLEQSPQRKVQENFGNIVNTMLPFMVSPYSVPTHRELLLNQRLGPTKKLIDLLPATQRQLAPVGGGGSGGAVQTWDEMAAAGSNLSPEVQKALQESQRTKERAAVGDKPGKGIFDRLKGLPGDVAGGVARTGLGALDLVSRPGYVTGNVAKQLVKNAQEYESRGGGNILANVAGGLGLSPGELDDVAAAAGRGVTGTEKTSGADLLKEAGVKNKIALGVGGLAVDVVKDPASWVSFGGTSAARAGTKEVAQSLAKAGISGTRQRLIKQGLVDLQRATSKGAKRGARRLTQHELDSAVGPALAWQAENLPTSTAARKVFSDAIKAGKSQTEAQHALEQFVEDAHTTLKSNFEQAANKFTKGRVEARIGFMGRGKNVLPERVGEAAWRVLDKPREVIGKTGFGQAVKNAFDYETKFPGLTGEIRAAAMSGAVKRSDDLRNEIKQIFEGTNREERKRISHAIEQKVDLTGSLTRSGKDMEQLRQYAMSKLKDFGQEEVNLGLRNQSDLIDDSYMYHFYKTFKHGKAAKEFRDLRKQVLRNPATVTIPTDMTLEAAKLKGLRPEEDIASILMGRGGKSNRDIARHWFDTEVLNTYGMNSAKKIGNASKLGYHEVSAKDLPKQLQALVKKDGAWYIPKEMWKVRDAYRSMSSILNSNEINSFLRGLDTTNRWFKFSKTVLRPGYHINNMMTDATMSWIDGTTGRDYFKAIRDWNASRNGRSAIKNIGGNAISFDEEKNLYRNLASGANYIHTEIPPSLAMTMHGAGKPGEALKGALGTATGALRKGSEKREDFFRFAHFRKAFDEEFGSLSKGKTLYGKARQDAMHEAGVRAARRVNKWNIDYAALTPFEQNVVRRAVPFYTFLRKATPLMIGAAATQPGRVLAVDKAKRAVSTLLGTEEQDSWDRLRIPDYLRDTGSFLQLTNGEEPWYTDISGMFPQYGALNPLGVEGPASGPEGSQNLAESVASKFNPLITLIPELARGKKYFANQPAGDLTQWAKSTFNPGTYYPLNKIPGLADERSRGLSVKEGLLRNFSTRQLNEATQVAAIKQGTNRDKQTISQLKQIMTQHGVELSTSRRKTGTVYRLLDRIHGREIGTYSSPAKAQEAFDRIYGGK